MKFVRGYIENKSNGGKNINLMPQLRTKDHLTKQRPIQTIVPQLLMKLYFSK